MFELHSDYKPTGDQPQAIEYLANGIKEGKKFQKVQKPTLVLAHNKTLAGQLYSEFKEFFPNSQVRILHILL